MLQVQTVLQQVTSLHLYKDACELLLAEIYRQCIGYYSSLYISGNISHHSNCVNYFSHAMQSAKEERRMN